MLLTVIDLSEELFRTAKFSCFAERTKRIIVYTKGQNRVCVFDAPSPVDGCRIIGWATLGYEGSMDWCILKYFIFKWEMNAVSFAAHESLGNGAANENIIFETSYYGDACRYLQAKFHR